MLTQSWQIKQEQVNESWVSSFPDEENYVDEDVFFSLVCVWKMKPVKRWQLGQGSPPPRSTVLQRTQLCPHTKDERGVQQSCGFNPPTFPQNNVPRIPTNTHSPRPPISYTPPSRHNHRCLSHDCTRGGGGGGVSVEERRQQENFWPQLSADLSAVRGGGERGNGGRDKPEDNIKYGIYQY